MTEAHKDQLVSDGNGPSQSRHQLSYAKTPTEYKALAEDVFTNPTFWMMTVFSSALNFFIAGFSAFGPKYFEFGYSMTPSLAGIMFGMSRSTVRCPLLFSVLSFVNVNLDQMVPLRRLAFGDKQSCCTWYWYWYLSCPFSG